MTFLELATRVLEENKRPMSVLEIWDDAVKKGYTALLESEGKTPRATLGSRLHTSANDVNNPYFSSVGFRPKKFYLTNITPLSTIKEGEGDEIENKQQTTNSSYKERDLHALLAYFIKNELDCYPKTINHSTSKKSTYGEWVHPDMVACYFPVHHWKSETYEISKLLGDTQVSLLSFELKISLSFSNLRESFFQAVSNSSWAHEGYLVAANIRDDKEFHDELNRLSRSFGIGVIKLDIEDPDNSSIIYPAEEREYIDWETVDKLTMNKDFREFLSRVTKDSTSKEIREEWYDNVMKVDALIQIFR